MIRTATGYSVDTPALLVRGPADVNVLQGETVVLSATYCGQPEPIVRWLKGVSAVPKKRPPHGVLYFSVLFKWVHV